MLTIRCEPIAGLAHSIGPIPYFRIEGSSLRIGPGDAEIGIHQGGMWQIAGRYYTTLMVDSPTTVRFEHGDDGGDCAGTHGPFDSVRLVDGVIRHGPHFKQLLARLDEALQSWHVYRRSVHCPRIIFEPA